MNKGQTAYVYIMSNWTHSTVYVGVTSDLERRVAEHKSHSVPGFTQKYNVDQLVYCEESPSINDAIAREKQIKKYSRAKKNRLIYTLNPGWKDLAKSS